jgi:hypothetical protein
VLQLLGQFAKNRAASWGKIKTVRMTPEIRCIMAGLAIKINKSKIKHEISTNQRAEKYLL